MTVTRRRRIVVLGGGSGGVAVAATLGDLVGEAHEVILVDRSPVHVYMPALLMLMTRERAPQDITRPLSRLSRHNVRVLQSTIEGGSIPRVRPSTWLRSVFPMTSWSSRWGSRHTRKRYPGSGRQGHSTPGSWARRNGAAMCSPTSTAAASW